MPGGLYARLCHAFIVCKYIVVETPSMYELWVLQRFKMPSDLQTNSRSLGNMPLDRPYMVCCW